MYWRGSNNIKDLLFRVLDAKAAEFKGKVVIDMPAGNGVTSARLLELGADVRALDLFPEFFKVPGVICEKVDLGDRLPLADSSVDWIIFQEGIEHLQDQLKILRDCVRVLKPGGRMILTTPNTSNLRSKLAHFLLEAETLRVLPPNEVDSVWMADGKSGAEERVYFGHLFSIGIQRLRTLGKVAGLEISQIHPARVNWTSFGLFVLSASWIYWKSARVYRRSLRKKSLKVSPPAYDEALRLTRDLNILCSGHLIVEFRKFSSAALEKRAGAIEELRSFVT
ncbi:MAG: class I SAM-dependent methyltransferase [Bdellovibrionaceae bacterium]|nr:class I SAM-dependent methyltransferase [Pseudobdellovibrionaceae bacterium]